TASPRSSRRSANGLVPSGIGQHINPLRNPLYSNQQQPLTTEVGAMPQYGGGTEKCARCMKSVYMAEKKVGAGRPFHTRCFSCYTCKRKLDAMTLTEHKGEIFCRGCYTRQYGVHGVASGVTMSTENPSKNSSTRHPRRSSYGDDLNVIYPPPSQNQNIRQRSHSNEGLVDEGNNYSSWKDNVIPINKDNNNRYPQAINNNKTFSKQDQEIRYENETTLNIDHPTATNRKYHGLEAIINYHNVTPTQVSQRPSGMSNFIEIPVTPKADRHIHVGAVSELVLNKSAIKPSESPYSNRSRSPSPVDYQQQRSTERLIEVNKEKHSHLTGNDHPTINFASEKFVEPDTSSKYRYSETTHNLSSYTSDSKQQKSTGTTNTTYQKSRDSSPTSYDRYSSTIKPRDSSSIKYDTSSTTYDRSSPRNSSYNYVEQTTKTVTTTNHSGGMYDRSGSSSSSQFSESKIPAKDYSRYADTVNNNMHSYTDITSPISVLPSITRLSSSTSTTSTSRGASDSALGSFVSTTHNMASNMTSSPVDSVKNPTLAALIKPQRLSSQESSNESED
ncbi:unnamed protein product, partial [Didymodactylos carnosus]